MAPLLSFLLLSLAFLPEYPAQVVRVIDGDTVSVHVYPWPGLIVETRIRLLGVDTPELRGKCEEEKRGAREARASLAKLLPAGTPVRIRNIKQDKYAGRHDAEIRLEDGRSVAEVLIGAGLARPYDGGTRAAWCLP
jgi:endonuclease YncB( thermonuclease family)